MRSKTYTVTSSATKTVPTDSKAGAVHIQANYTAGTSYTVEYTLSDFRNPDITTEWTAVTDMDAAVADAEKRVNEPIKALRLTHVGTNNTVFTILQSPDNV